MKTSCSSYLELACPCVEEILWAKGTGPDVLWVVDRHRWFGKFPGVPFYAKPPNGKLYLIPAVGMGLPGSRPGKLRPRDIKAPSQGFGSSSIHDVRMCNARWFAWITLFFSREEFLMSQFRVVVLSAVAFVAAGFGSVAMAGCGGDNGCGGSRGGLLSRLHAKKSAACSGAVAKDCSGGGLLNKLGSRRATKCSGAAVANNCAPAPAASCETGCGAVESSCGGCASTAAPSGCTGCGGATVIGGESVMVGSTVSGAAPCTNCGTAVNAGVVESSTIAPPVPSAPAAGAPVAPAAPAVPAAPVSASDVPKA